MAYYLEGTEILPAFHQSQTPSHSQKEVLVVEDLYVRHAVEGDLPESHIIQKKEVWNDTISEK